MERGTVEKEAGALPRYQVRSVRDSTPGEVSFALRTYVRVLVPPLRAGQPAPIDAKLLPTNVSPPPHLCWPAKVSTCRHTARNDRSRRTPGPRRPRHLAILHGSLFEPSRRQSPGSLPPRPGCAAFRCLRPRPHHQPPRVRALTQPLQICSHLSLARTVPRCQLFPVRTLLQAAETEADPPARPREQTPRKTYEDTSRSAGR